MKAFMWLLLAAFAAYAAYKYYNVSVQVERKVANTVVAPAGVNFYCDQPVTSRFQQTQAYESVNPDMATEAGFAAAFGPNENQPQNVATLEI
jgi:hypothetical protein